MGRYAGRSRYRRYRYLACLLALVLLMLGWPAAPRAVGAGGVTDFVPTLAELSRLVEATMTGYTVGALPAGEGDWAASGDYLVSFGGATAGMEIYVAASVLPSTARAGSFFREMAQRLEADNERTDRLSDETAAWYGLDDLRAYRLIYRDEENGERVSNYVRLLRLGSAVAVIEAIGDPAADDEGYVDSDRGLMLTRTFELVLGKLRWAAPDGVGAVANLGGHARTWSRHGFGIAVDTTGRAEGSWRAYRWCSDDPTPPCDGTVGNQIVNGGAARLVFYHVDGAAAQGVVIESADDAVLPLGPVELTLQPYGMAKLSSLGRTLRGADDLDLCGPDFSTLAPESLRRQAPCGA